MGTTRGLLDGRRRRRPSSVIGLIDVDPRLLAVHRRVSRSMRGLLDRMDSRPLAVDTTRKDLLDPDRALTITRTGDRGGVASAADAGSESED